MLVYAFFIGFGTYYIFKLLLQGPTVEATTIPGATARRPMAFADDAASATGNYFGPERLPSQSSST